MNRVLRSNDAPPSSRAPFFGAWRSPLRLLRSPASGGQARKDTQKTLLFSLFLLFVSLVFFSSFCFAADPVPNPELEGILQKIEARHYRWIAIRSDVYLFFAKAGNPDAMCGGELLYQRLDERMSLSCAESNGELVFAFRTLDRRFDLYLPSQKKVYHGSIFDMEDSPDIESHLKARDLYRALKPMAVDARHAKIERTNSLVTSLDVYDPKNGGETLARKLYLTPEGDVRGEIFYDAAGRPATEIRRYDFREIPGRSGSFRSIIFPKKITILSPETQKSTVLFFRKVKAVDAIDSPEFLLRVPEGTQEVFIEEKDLRPAPPKTATAPAPTPVPVYRAVPTYYAKPRKQPEPKKIRKPAPIKKEVPQTKKPVSAPSAAPEDPKISSEAAILVEPTASQTPLSYDQTTLDPSVAPSLEMKTE